MQISIFACDKLPDRVSLYMKQIAIVADIAETIKVRIFFHT